MKFNLFLAGILRKQLLILPEKCDIITSGDIMKLLKRKIDNYLEKWKSDPGRLPLIVKGAHQIGKTESIRFFC